MSGLVFVRHSEPQIDPSEPAGSWPLSPSGHDFAAELGNVITQHLDGATARVAASSERKAIETAEGLGLGSVIVRDELREVSKPWYPEPQDHQDAAARYLSGQAVAGWEPQRDAIERFDGVVASRADETVVDESVVLVTHGTVFTLWMNEHMASFEPVEFWNSLSMPDAYEVDTATGKFEQLRRE